MEELAKKLQNSIDEICRDVYYRKQYDAVSRGAELKDDIELFTSELLRILQSDTSEEASQIKEFTLQVLTDYVEAAANEDELLMTDTLDNGLSELLKLFIDE